METMVRKAIIAVRSQMKANIFCFCSIPGDNMMNCNNMNDGNNGQNCMDDNTGEPGPQGPPGTPGTPGRSGNLISKMILS